ncbi:phage holin family protein [bacterium]|nr:phage holin family protein [bacterium]MCI0565715.1 phage holin family protein [bacterium]MCI0679982.1 phage holin family protein [bacterium]
MNLLIHLIISTCAVMVAAYLIPGVAVDGWFAALVVAVVLGLLNLILKPILIILTLPINIITLGLFTLVINTGLVLLAGAIVPGFHPGSFFAALLFGILLSLINILFKKD